MHKTTSFPRRDLYDMVWETPLTQLAETIGISDVALAKSCRRADIPLPGRGYWAKGERDRPRKPPLPKLKDAYYEIIRFQLASANDSHHQRKLKPEKGEPIIVSARLDSPHPLVAQTLRAVNKAKENHRYLSPPSGRALDIRVSPGALDRAARLMDTLIKASETRGHIWRATENGPTDVEVDGETLHIRLHEKLKRHELPPPPRPARTLGTRPWEPDLDALFALQKQYEWRPTGILTFGIDGTWRTGSIRKNWNDTEHGSLDNKLHEVLAGLAPAAAAIKAYREECERRRKAEEERAARRREEELRVAHQRHLRARLLRATAQWERAQRLRAFQTAVSARLDELALPQRERAESWLRWVDEQIDKLDPLQSDLSGLIDLDPPSGDSVTHDPQNGDEWDWWSINRRRY